VVPGGTHNQKALADARQLGRQHNIPLHGTVLELISIIDQLHTAAEVSHHTCPRRCKRSGSRLGESTDDKQQFCLQVSRAEGGGHVVVETRSRNEWRRNHRGGGEHALHKLEAI